MTLTDKEPAQIRVVHPNGPDPRPVQHKGQHQKQEKKQALPVEDQLHCLLNISSPQSQHRNRCDEQVIYPRAHSGKCDDAQSHGAQRHLPGAVPVLHGTEKHHKQRGSGHAVIQQFRNRKQILHGQLHLCRKQHHSQVYQTVRHKGLLHPADRQMLTGHIRPPSIEIAGTFIHCECFPC